jgi:peroxiredoxin
MSLRASLRKLPAPLADALRERLYPRLLAEGETAPEWHLQGWDDAWHRQGKHWSLLVFYVDSADAGDRAYLRHVQEQLAAFSALGVKLYAVHPAEAPEHRDLAAAEGLAFPILSDRGGSVARQFRALVQLPLGNWPTHAVYLVNPARKIRLANRGRPSLEAILRSVQALQQVARAGM